MKYTRTIPVVLLLALALNLVARAQDAIPWIQDLAEARRLAEQQQRLVMLHFWGDGCPPCAQLENNVFNQPEFIRVVATNFIPVKINVQDQPNIAKYYGIKRIPTDVIVLPTGKEVFRTESPAKANAYIAMLDQVRANAATSGLVGLDRVARNAEQSAQNAVQNTMQNTQTAVRNTQDTLQNTFQNTVQDTTQQVDRTAQNAMNAADKWKQDALNTANQWNQNALNAADRRTQDATNRANDLARGALNRFQQAMPSLPPREGEEPTSQPYNSDPGVAVAPPAEDNQAWQNAPTADESSRSAIVTNRFVGPTDPAAGTSSKPADGSRYSNPYVGNAPVAQSQGTGPQGTGPQGSVAPAPQTAPPQNYAGMGNVQPGYGPQGNAPYGQPAANQPPAGQPNPATVARQALPPGVPPLALDGYCPVTLVRSQKWEQGSAQFGAIHRGRTYFFKSKAEQDQFLAPGAADQFAPVLSGYDPVRFAELHQTVEGSREHGVIYQNQIYLFADEQALAQFEQQPERYVNVVRQAMANARPNQPQR